MTDRDDHDDRSRFDLERPDLILPEPAYTVEPTPDRHRPVHGNTTFDERARALYIECLARTGRIYISAQMAGTTTVTVRRHMKADAAFAEECEEALEAYRDAVRSTIQRRALEGDLEPIIGRVGKDVDGVIAYKRRFSDAILAMEAKRIDPEYRERGSLDVNVKMAGVLVVGTQMSAADWITQFGGKHLPEDPLEGLPGLDRHALEVLEHKDE